MENLYFPILNSSSISIFWETSKLEIFIKFCRTFIVAVFYFVLKTDKPGFLEKTSTSAKFNRIDISLISDNLPFLWENFSLRNSRDFFDIKLIVNSIRLFFPHCHVIRDLKFKFALPCQYSAFSCFLRLY